LIVSLASSRHRLPLSSLLLLLLASVFHRRRYISTDVSDYDQPLLSLDRTYFSLSAFKVFVRIWLPSFLEIGKLERERARKN
jgi:hypothetical protein